jgi:RNA polymerase sigma-70 factor (ECF subfamily)
MPPPTSANGKLAVAGHLWDGDAGAHLAWSVNMLTLRGDRIADVTAFIGLDHFAAFGLPASLP